MDKFIPPQIIHITSDDTIIEFVKVIPKSKTQKLDMYRYVYTKAITKLGSEIDFTEEYLSTQLTNYFNDITNSSPLSSRREKTKG